jgi:hypothetical protein
MSKVMTSAIRLAVILKKLEQREIDYQVRLSRTSTGLSFYVPGYPMCGTNNLAKIYTAVLNTMTDDSPIELMGLDKLLGVQSSRSLHLLDVDSVHLGYVVAWVNQSVIEAVRPHLLRQGDYYNRIVSFFDETVGLYAIRRILLCLLHYMEKAERLTPTTHQAYDQLQNSVETADSLANAIEVYLEGNNRDDEGVCTLELGSTSTMKLLRKLK